jgi:hypothetical protein
MRFAANQLRDKALLALEEAVQECRYRKPPRTMALRFALAFLWSQKPTSRAPYEAWWRAIDAKGMWRFSGADQALTLIYQAHEIPRDDEVAMELWRRRHEAEHGGNR